VAGEKDRAWAGRCWSGRPGDGRVLWGGTIPGALWRLLEVLARVGDDEQAAVVRWDGGERPAPDFMGLPSAGVGDREGPRGRHQQGVGRTAPHRSDRVKFSGGPEG